MARILDSNSLADSELWISRLLRWGALLSSSIIAVGWIYQVCGGEQNGILLGLLLLILLPVLRVLMTVGIFMVQRDYLFVAFSSFVLLVIGFGFYWGLTL